MRRLLIAAVLIVALGGAAFWGLTTPRRAPDDAYAGLTGDAGHGAEVFWAAGCASCHTAPGAEATDRPVLAGGQKFPSAYGTFSAPNISPSPQGIGGWSVADLGNAMQHGVTPGGEHLYPVFPYTTYVHATPQDVADVKAFLDTLPPSDAAYQPGDVTFPFSIRRGMGLWKLAFLDAGWAVTGDLTPEETRGRYLAEALGHCGACHTPRTLAGAEDRGRWLGGAPDPSGKGRVPNITPAHLTWSKDEIATYLGSGFTPEYDSAGGLMAEVVTNLGHLPDADRLAIAAYLARVPPVE